MSNEDRIGEEYGCFVITDVVKVNNRTKYVFTCKECGYQSIQPYKYRTCYVVKFCTHKTNNPLLPYKTYNPYGAKYKPKFKSAKMQTCFNDICRRCYDTNNKSYKWYGGKGIVVCDEWLNNPSLFEEWALNNGYKDGLTIDRINSDENYCPENCRWITLEENARRAGKVNWITIGEETLTGRQWSEKLGLGVMSINKWVKNYGLDRTIKLIEAIQKDPNKKNERKSHQNLFDLYDV